MDENEADNGTGGTAADDRPRSSSPRPSGWRRSTRIHLAELLYERLNGAAGPALAVDVELAVVWSTDRSWSASLGPLQVRLAHLPRDGWPRVIDHEIERWRRAAAAVQRRTGVDRHVGARSAGAPIVLRLSTAAGAPERTVRSGFGDVMWELVRDLGHDGLATLPRAREEQSDRTVEEKWDRHAAETVDRHERRWSRLVLRDVAGIVLSGPAVSALLFDPGRLRSRVDDVAAGSPLRTIVFTNSLLLVIGGDAIGRPAVELVAESLRRFSAGTRRHFEPFTVDLPGADDRSGPVGPM